MQLLGQEQGMPSDAPRGTANVAVQFTVAGLLGAVMGMGAALSFAYVGEARVSAAQFNQSDPKPLQNCPPVSPATTANKAPQVVTSQPAMAHSSPASPGTTASRSSQPVAAPPIASPDSPDATAPSDGHAPQGVEPRAAPAAARTDAPARVPPAGAPAASQRFFIQLGAFNTQQRSAELISELEQKGYSAHILAGSDYQRVVTGPFSTQAEAARARQELEKHGYKPIVKRY